jgi:hypothetical protein
LEVDGLLPSVYHERGNLDAGRGAMSGNAAGTLVQCGRRFSEQEIEQICETVRMFPALPLTELVGTICEHLGWYTAGGGPKGDACEKLLLKLQGRGLVRVPEKRIVRREKHTIAMTERTACLPPIVGSLRGVSALRLELVEGRREEKLFNEYVERYHPLGYRRPFGYPMRYFMESDRGKLGCFLFCGAAKSLGARDRWIRWTEAQRLQRLAWVVNLNRHLVFPWVEVRNLSSHVLGLLSGRIVGDWEKRWGYRPVLLETFVDPRQHEGSCYKGAGWEEVGMTSGEGLVRPGQRYSTTPKKIFLKPLCKDFRALLCSELPPARGLE